MWLAYRYYIINLTVEHNIQGSPYLYPTLSVMIRPCSRDEPPEVKLSGSLRFPPLVHVLALAVQVLYELRQKWCSRTATPDVMILL